jgi:hypothetical protein
VRDVVSNSGARYMTTHPSTRIVVPCLVATMGPTFWDKLMANRFSIVVLLLEIAFVSRLKMKRAWLKYCTCPVPSGKKSFGLEIWGCRENRDLSIPVPLRADEPRDFVPSDPTFARRF